MEKIIGEVEGLGLRKVFFLRPERYHAVFINERIIFLKGFGYVVGGHPPLNLLLNKVADMMTHNRIEDLTIDQILNNDQEKIILQRPDLFSVMLQPASLFSRGKIIFNQDGKQFKFTFKKRENFDKFSSILAMLKMSYGTNDKPLTSQVLGVK